MARYMVSINTSYEVDADDEEEAFDEALELLGITPEDATVERMDEEDEEEEEEELE